MDFRWIIKVFIAFILLGGMFSCSKDDSFEVESETCDVIVEGFSFAQEGEGGGLKVIDINRQTGNINESLNTPQGVGGYTVNVYSPVGATSPYISEEFKFVDAGGENNGVVRNVKKGVNRFVAESVKDKDLFDNNPVVGEYFDNGWNVWGSVGKVWSGNSDYRLSEYKDAIEDLVPCYTAYRGEIEYDIVPGQDNVVPFEMKVINGRILVVVENNTSRNVDVSYNGRTEQLGVDKVLFILLNDDSETKVNLRINISYYRKKKNGRWQLRNSKQNFDLEPGKNIARLINVE